MTLTFKKGQLRELLPLALEPAKATHCRIRAHNDIEAMERWLDEYFDKPTTFRTYKKEAERFLVWCNVSRSTSLSRLDRDDVEAYIEFLKDPQPRDLWCGPRRKKEGILSWFPFAGPLKPGAIKTALASLNSLMSYLVDARYVEFNPFALVRRKSRFKRNLEETSFTVQERILDDNEFQTLLAMLEEEDESTDLAHFQKNRLRFLVAVLFFLGLRIDELTRATWNDCRKSQGKWWFFVVGKGDRLGKVPINSQLLEAIMRFRHSIKKSPLPDLNDDGPLIHHKRDTKKALSARQISNLIKDIAIKAAHKFPPNSEAHEKLMRFSPHWLRHLSASRQDLAGISFTNIKSNLRHQNEQTTRIYVHAHDDTRHEEMEKLKI